MDPDRRVLSERERQVLALSCAGRSISQIAFELGVTPRAIKNHRHRIYQRLGAHGLEDACAERSTQAGP